MPVVVLEPSCLALLREDAHDLVDDQHLDLAGHVAGVLRTLAEHLTALGLGRRPT